MEKINITVSSGKTINATVHGRGELPYYDGEYTVAPKIGEQQTLETAKKSMRHNVVVNEIPVGTVVNSAGGNTVIIG